MNHVAGIELPPMDIVRAERGEELKKQTNKKDRESEPLHFVRL